MMKTIYALLITLATYGTVSSQSISQYVIGDAGMTLSGASNTLSFTLGESVIGNISNGESLGQGFWLGAIEEVVLGEEDFSSSTQATVYPNPVSDYLNITFADLAGEEFLVQMVDITGKVVFQKNLENNQGTETISLNTLSAGIYLLNITRKENQQSKTFKIIKQ